MFGFDLDAIMPFLAVLGTVGGFGGIAAVITARNQRVANEHQRDSDHRKWVEETRQTLREEMNSDLERVRTAYRELRDEHLELDRKHFELSVDHDDLQRAHRRLKAEYEDLQAAYERLREQYLALQVDLEASRELSNQLKELHNAAD